MGTFPASHVSLLRRVLLTTFLFGHIFLRRTHWHGCLGVHGNVCTLIHQNAPVEATTPSVKYSPLLESSNNMAYASGATSIAG